METQSDREGNWVWLVFNAAMATYDGYQAYKKARAEGKRGYKLALAVAWAVAGNYIKVGKVYKYLRIAKGKASSYKNITKKTAIVKNRETNVSHLQFIRNLKKSGWKLIRSKDRKGYILTKNGAKYYVRPYANSWKGWSADYTPRGNKKATVKIRLGGK